MSLESARRRQASSVAMAALLAGLFIAVLTAIAAVGWLRDGLRYGCSPIPTGGRIEWYCGDGLVLMGPGVAIVGAGAVALLIAALLVQLAAVEERPRSRRPVGLALLACLPTLAVCLLLLSTAGGHDAAEPVTPSRVALWLQHALPALLATVAASLVGAVGVRMRATARAPRVARALVLGSLALLIVGAGVSMLGLLSTAAVAASIIGAAWSLAAAAPSSEPAAPIGDLPPVAVER